MERVGSDSSCLEFNVTEEGIETLRMGGSVSVKCGKGHAYLSDLERHIKKSKDNIKDDHAIMDAESMRIDIYVSWESIANQYCNSKIFSRKLSNLTIEPESAKKEYEDMRIKVNFLK